MRQIRESTKKLYDRVLAMHESGMSYKEIAEETGYNQQYISQIIVYMLGSSVKKATKEDVQKMIELRKSGMSCKEIAKVVGFSKSTVQKQLAKTGHLKCGVARSVETRTVYSDPEEFMKGTVTMQTRKPQVHDVVIKGKKYKDITELIAGI